MASTYTSNIRLTKQGDGENPNNWGAVANTVFDLVDEAITAYTTIRVSSVDVTLSNNNGSTDQSRSAFIEIAGTVSVNSAIILPANSKGYIVRHNAVVENDATVTFKTAAGTGSVLTAATTNIMMCDSVSVTSLVLPTGNAGNLNVGTSINELIPVSSADIRYATVSTANIFTADNTFINGTFTGNVIVSGTSTFTSAATFTGPVITGITSLTDAASVTWDLAAGNIFSLTITGNRTLAYPTNGTVGQTGHIYITQDGTGGRTLGYNDSWKFAGGTAPTLTSVSGSVDMLVYSFRNTSIVDGSIINDFK